MAWAASLYGVLDLARAPELNDHVQRLAPTQSICLFRGDLDPEVERHSPHLVELDQSDPLTRLWVSRGWGQSWGVWIESTAGLRQVWRRMRHFTQATLPDGSGPVLFRFWDPRVFRTYLPTVEPGQLPEWFKDVDAYVVESEDGSGSIRYALQGGALSVRPGARPGG